MSYHEKLEIQTNASMAEIKQAYRKMAMRYHPDRHPQGGELQQQAEEKFKIIQEAYDILSKNQGLEPSPAPSPRSTRKPNPKKEASNPSIHTIELILKVSMEKWMRGFVHVWDAEVPLFKECNRCGPQMRPWCQYCQGTGRTAFKAINIGIDARTAPGKKLTINAHYKTSRGAPVKMLVTIEVRENTQLRISKDTLNTASVECIPRPVLFFGGLWNVALGCDTMSMNIMIPPNTKSGNVLRLRGMGQTFFEDAGDMLVTAQTLIPKTLRERIQELQLFAIYGFRSTYKRLVQNKA